MYELATMHLYEPTMHELELMTRFGSELATRHGSELPMHGSELIMHASELTLHGSELVTRHEQCRLIARAYWAVARGPRDFRGPDIQFEK